MREICVETIQNLIELHQLEDQSETAKSGKAEIQARIEEIRGKLIPNILGHHDRMRIRKKKSVAEVRGSVCSGCNTTVATGILGTLRRMDDIQLCANCGRYLFIKNEPPPPVEPEAVKPVKKRKSKTPPPVE